MSLWIIIIILYIFTEITARGFLYLGKISDNISESIRTIYVLKRLVNFIFHLEIISILYIQKREYNYRIFLFIDLNIIDDSDLIKIN